MALVRCPNCGMEYSNKVPKCPHCGFMPAVFVCSECNAIIDRASKSCWNCGNPIMLESLVPASNEMINYVYQQNMARLNENLTSIEYDQLIKSFSVLGNYGDSKAMIVKCTKLKTDIAVKEKEKKEYNLALEKMYAAKSSTEFERLLNQVKNGYASVDKEVDVKLASIQLKEMQYQEAIVTKDAKVAFAKLNKVGDYKDALERAESLKQVIDKQNKKRKKTIIVVSLILAVIVAATVVVVKCVLPKLYYEKGTEAFASKDYATALEYFEQSDGYKDSDKKIAECSYNIGIKLFNQSKYGKASDYFKKAGNYKDSKILYYYCSGFDAFNNEHYQTAVDMLSKTNGYGKSANLIAASKIMLAERSFLNGDYAEAKTKFAELPSNLTYNGVNVGNRLSLINKYAGLLALEGSFSNASGSLEVRQTSKSYGSWHNWTSKNNPGSFTFDLKINTDGTATISGTAKFWIYTKYSSLSSVVTDGEVYKTVSFTKTISGNPSNLVIGDYTKLSISGNKAYLSYYKYDSNQDIYFNYFYKSYYVYTK